MLQTRVSQASSHAGGRQSESPPLAQFRGKPGGPGVSDDEFLLRTIMKGEDEIRAMRAAGPARPYHHGAAPLVTLLEELSKHRQVRYVRVERGSDSLVVRNRPGLRT
jgi:oxaloacetate decarboxylase alpha subunit